jgi:hypothetical protein
VAWPAQRRAGRTSPSEAAAVGVNGVHSGIAQRCRAGSRRDPCPLGGHWRLAVAFRSEPRFTKDIDLAVAVSDDLEAESIVSRLQVRGYALSAVVEQDYVGRLATVRLIRPVRGTSSAFIDLMFANSGIEVEVVDAADRVEVLPGAVMPVASTGHLIALKVLAGRDQDLIDLGYLLAAATDADILIKI